MLEREARVLERLLSEGYFKDECGEKGSILRQAEKMIEVRETTVNELALVQGLWADGDVMRFVGFPEGLHQTDEEMRGWFRRIESRRPALNHYSIFEDGRYCGESFYKIDEAHQSAALDIKLFSFARGRGIGTAGLSYAIREAFRNGAKIAWVDPNPKNEKAIALYERLGFQRSAFPKHLLSEGEEPSSVYMELRKDSVQFEGQPRL